MIVTEEFWSLMCSNAPFYKTKQKLWSGFKWLEHPWCGNGKGLFRRLPCGLISLLCKSRVPFWQFSCDASPLLITLNFGVQAGVSSSNILLPSAAVSQNKFSVLLNVGEGWSQLGNFQTGKYVLLTFLRLFSLAPFSKGLLPERHLAGHEWLQFFWPQQNSSIIIPGVNLACCL